MKIKIGMGLLILTLGLGAVWFHGSHMKPMSLAGTAKPPKLLIKPAVPMPVKFLDRQRALAKSLVKPPMHLNSREEPTHAMKVTQNSNGVASMELHVKR